MWISVYKCPFCNWHLKYKHLNCFDEEGKSLGLD